MNFLFKICLFEIRKLSFNPPPPPFSKMSMCWFIKLLHLPKNNDHYFSPFVNVFNFVKVLVQNNMTINPSLYFNACSALDSEPLVVFCLRELTRVVPWRIFITGVRQVVHAILASPWTLLLINNMQTSMTNTLMF